MVVIRFIMSRLLLLLDFIFKPSKGERSLEKQKEIEEELKNYSLYQFHGCPFCIKVRRVMRKLNLPIELRNANTNEDYKAELLAKGGSSKVPCLRIGDTWMYESDDIVKFLKDKFPV